MKALGYFLFAVTVHAGIAFVIFTVWGLPVFVLYSGFVTGALAFDDLRHRQREHA